MYFEIREESRKRALGRVYCRATFPLVVGRCISGILEPHGGERGHTCGDNAGTRWEVVMSKIESSLQAGGSGWRSQSELRGAESFDQDHGPAALGTSPKRPWWASAFSRRLSFENPT